MKNGFHISFITHDLDRVGPWYPPNLGVDHVPCGTIWTSRLNMKTVTYVSGTFVTHVSGPHTRQGRENKRRSGVFHDDFHHMIFPTKNSAHSRD